MFNNDLTKYDEVNVILNNSSQASSTTICGKVLEITQKDGLYFIRTEEQEAVFHTSKCFRNSFKNKNTQNSYA